MFYVGQKVVCVSAPNRARGYPDDVTPRIGSIYTIRKIEMERKGGIYPVGLMLDEIKNTQHWYRGYDGLTETSFRATRFRPLVERKTDISIFKSLLEPANCKESV